MSRRKGCYLEFAHDRIDALMRLYHQYISSAPHIRMGALFEHIVNQPCKRFWVSEIRAASVIAKMMKGYNLNDMHPSKREMYLEIYARVCRFRHLNPKIPLSSIVADVVCQPAPKFYLSPSSAKIMIYKAKKEWYKKRKPKSSR